MRTRSYNKFQNRVSMTFVDYNMKLVRKKTRTQLVVRMVCVLFISALLFGFLTGLNSNSSVVSAQQSTRKFNPVKSGYVIKTQSSELNRELRELFCPRDSEGKFCQDAMDDSEHMVGVVALLHRQHKLDRTVFLNVKKVKEGYVFSVLVFDKANYVVVDLVDLVPDLETLHGYVMGIGGKGE